MTDTYQNSKIPNVNAGPSRLTAENHSLEVYSDRPATAVHSGWTGVGIIGVFLLLITVGIVMMSFGTKHAAVFWIGFTLVIVLSCVIFVPFMGFFIIRPNNAAAITYIGTYVGTVSEPGFYFINPIGYSVTKVSMRMRNFETDRLKVNDKRGNPIEIGGVVVWKVTDCAEALYHVNDYEKFVKIQSESAFRNLAARYPYDSYEEGEVSLLTSTSEISQELADVIQERLHVAGILVCEAQLTRLAFSPEIAGAMLQRQQASAVVAARTEIVKGAVGMVDQAIDMIEDAGVCTFTEGKKADIVGNLLIVLCGDSRVQPTLPLAEAPKGDSGVRNRGAGSANL